MRRTGSLLIPTIYLVTSTHFEQLSPVQLQLFPILDSSYGTHIIRMAATILITGASGLIGFRILLAALAAGHHVRYTVRSEEKAKIVASNPAIQKLRTSGKDVPSVSPVVIPDFTVGGAFDAAVEGVTHIIHAGSPVPVATYDPTTQVFEPTLVKKSPFYVGETRD